MTERIFRCGVNKMSFEGKTTDEINVVLRMFGGNWKEDKPQQITHFKCRNCNNIIDIPVVDYNKMEKHIYELNKILVNNIDVDIDIMNILNKIIFCCEIRDYYEIDSTFEYVKGEKK